MRTRIDRTPRLLRAALDFALVPPTEPELRLLHWWLDCWRGVGDVVTGMKRQGYEVSLGDHGAGRWIATFYRRHGGYEALRVTARDSYYRRGQHQSGERDAAGETRRLSIRKRTKEAHGSRPLPHSSRKSFGRAACER